MKDHARNRATAVASIMPPDIYVGMKYLVAAIAIPTLLLASRADATLLTTAGEQQLETWLGRGDLTFTSIFTKTAGDGKTSLDFHAAADGKGETFTLIDVAGLNGQHYLIGGYDPLSWNSSGGFNLVTNDAQRTAFIFNLTSGVIEREILGQPLGQYQTYDSASFGPTFGGGSDLNVAQSLQTGYVFSDSYGAGSLGTNLFGTGVNPGGGADGDYYDFSLQYAGLQVFTFAPATTSTPEPSSALFGIALIASVAMRRWRPRATPPLA